MVDGRCRIREVVRFEDFTSDIACVRPATHVIVSAGVRIWACKEHAEMARELGKEVEPGGPESRAVACESNDIVPPT
jgi:hypothetical protein